MASQTDVSTRSKKKEVLERKLRDWWDQWNEDWEADAEDTSRGGEGVWNHMPEIDSKEVARAGHIAENHLDTEFDPKMIPPGGYDSIDALIDDLVPKMLEKWEVTD